MHRKKGANSRRVWKSRGGGASPSTELRELDLDGFKVFQQIRHPEREPWLVWEDGVFWLFQPDPDKGRPSVRRLSAADAMIWLHLEGYRQSAKDKELLEAVIAQAQG
jgi:hypothetical protein